MKEKATRAPIENEAANGLKNNKYTIAMARTSAPHSASSQFFINVVDNDFLNTRLRTRRVGATPSSARSRPARTSSMNRPRSHLHARLLR